MITDRSAQKQGREQDQFEVDTYNIQKDKTDS